MKVSSFVKDIFWRFPYSFISTTVLLISLNVFSACSLFTLSPIVDFLIHPDLNDTSSLTAKIIHFLQIFRIPTTLTSWLIVFVGFVFLSSTFQILAYYSVARIRYKTLRKVLIETFEDFLNARWYFFSSEKQGVLLNTFTREFNIFGEAFRAAAEFFSTAVQIIVSLAIPFYISWQTTLVSLGVVLTFSAPFIFLSKYSYRLGRLNTAASNNLLSVIYENLEFAKLLLGFGNQCEGVAKLDKAFNSYSKVTVKSQMVDITIPLVYRPLAAFAIVVTLFSARHFNVPMSEMIVLIAALFQFVISVGKLTAKQNILVSSLPSYEQIECLRKRAIDLRQPSGGKEFTGFEKEIVLKDLSFAYPDHPLLLKDINLRIPKGAMIAFVGKSGSGKSTLMDIIMGFYTPFSGQITFDNVPLENYDIKSYRQRIGYVPQESILFNMSIKDNLLWAHPEASDQELRSVCRTAYADEFIEKLPEGYDTLVGDRGVRLSGGQVQRIALARAFLRKPELLILDEATSALDTHSERFIQEALENFSRETTVIAVAHRLSTIKKSDRIYVVDHGSIVEQGIYKDLVRDAGVFNSMAQLQELEILSL